MAINANFDPFVDAFAGAGAFADALRLAVVSGLREFRAAERLAAEAEQKRLEDKYGPKSRRAQDAAARLDQLDLELATLDAEIVRQQTVTPQTADGRFFVYGRVFDSTGQGLARVAVAAVDPKLTVLSRTTTGDLGRFELLVPLRQATGLNQAVGADESTRMGAVAPPAAITFQIQLTQPKAQAPYLDSETFVALPGQMAYREFLAPDMVRPIPVTTKPAVTKAEATKAKASKAPAAARAKKRK